MRARFEIPPRTGTGRAACHHGEILQGAFLDPRGDICPALVTLAMGNLGTYAEFVPVPDLPAERLTVDPPDRVKALRAAALTIETLDQRGRTVLCGGHLRLRGDVPVGLGMGSSTSDVIATIRAVVSSFGHRLSPRAVARLAVRAEEACDPLMLDGRPRLFAHRQGRVLEALGPALPSAVVVGCTTGGGRVVDTLALPAADYTDRDVSAFERLRLMLRRAVAAGDVALLGRVCTESAERNQRRLVKDELGVLVHVARGLGAAGVQVAHSGNVAGVLFDPAPPGLQQRLRACIRTLTGEGITVTRVFPTCDLTEDSHVPAHRRLPRSPGPHPRRRRTRLSSF